MPRRDILLDGDGNRVLINGQYGFADGAQAVRQGIQVRVKLFRGEYWLDTSRGVRWLELVFVRGTSPAAIKAEIASAIARTPDVTRVVGTSFAVDPSTRKGSVSYEAASPEGLVASTVAV